jgi:hypothetical protein
MMAFTLSSLLTGLVWVLLWGLGGWWLLRACFFLRENEQTVAGLALGLVLQAWLSNLLALGLPVMWAFWLGALLIFAAGLAALARVEGWQGLLHRPHLHWGQLLGFAFILYLFIAIGRGMAISDDFQNLPVTAMLAVGDIPLRFPLDPAVYYPYHYLNLLIAGQFMRLFDLFTWTATDAARGLSFALAAMLAGLWAQRLTRSALVGFFNSCVFVLVGGTRWLFLLLPSALLSAISTHVHLIGSGNASAPDLVSALVSPWATAGDGPYPFPFAYVNGFNTPLVINYHAGGGTIGFVIGWLLLMMANRRRNAAAWGVLGVLLAALALAAEVNLAFLCLGFGLLSVWDLARHRSLKPTPQVGAWFLIALAAGLVSLVQGGVLSGAAADLLARFTGRAAASYHTFQFTPAFPPALISGHLGALSLADPYQLLAALIEVGPILLALPLVAWWGVRAWRAGRWYEAVLVLSSLFGIAFLFVRFSGEAGPTALIRVQNLPVVLAGQVVLPLLWLWAARFSLRWKTILTGLLLSTLVSGLVLLCVQLLAIPHPVNSFFLTDLDTQAARDNWNSLPPDALVFDPSPARAPILFGRFTNASVDYFHSKPEWDTLAHSADPVQWRSHGFTFAYLDRSYLDSLSVHLAQNLQQSACMHLLKVYVQPVPEDERRLYDISDCR